jgi:hypothetical protein
MKPLPTLFLLCFIALLLPGCGGSYEPTYSKGLAECYWKEFGVRPPADVTNLHAKQVIIGDGARAWLRFDTTPSMVETLLKNFAPTNRETFAGCSGGANTPRWWTPDNDHVTAFYAASGWNKNFAHSFAVIAHDTNKHIVYFCHDGDF